MGAGADAVGGVGMEAQGVGPVQRVVTLHPTSSGSLWGRVGCLRVEGVGAGVVVVGAVGVGVMGVAGEQGQLGVLRHLQRLHSKAV